MMMVADEKVRVADKVMEMPEPAMPEPAMSEAAVSAMRAVIKTGGRWGQAALMRVSRLSCATWRPPASGPLAAMQKKRVVEGEVHGIRKRRVSNVRDTNDQTPPAAVQQLVFSTSTGVPAIKQLLIGA